MDTYIDTRDGSRWAFLAQQGDEIELASLKGTGYYTPTLAEFELNFESFEDEVQHSAEENHPISLC